MLKLGDKFPLQRLSLDGQPLSQSGSRYTALYFYPKDDTPGCTIEANEFQRHKSEYDRAGIRIVGVSVDDTESHQAFCRKFGLSFDLATDRSGNLGRELGILKPNQQHRRVTYVLDAQNRVTLEYPEVKPSEHARQILEDVGKLKPDQALAG